MTSMRCTARSRSGGSPLEDIEDLLPDDDDADFPTEERKSKMATKKVVAQEPAAKAAPATAKPAEVIEDNLVHLKTVAGEFDMDPRAVRIHLRAKGYKKPDGRWAWPEDHADLAKLRAELDAKSKEPEPVAEAPAAAATPAKTVVKKKAVATA